MTDNTIGSTSSTTDPFFNFLLLQKPINWGTILLNLNQGYEVGDNILHLAFAADDAQSRASSLKVLSTLIGLSNRQTLNSIDRKDGRNILHRSCVYVTDGLENSLNGCVDGDEIDDEPQLEHDGGTGFYLNLDGGMDSKSKAVIEKVRNTRDKYNKKWNVESISEPCFLFCKAARMLLKKADELEGDNIPYIHQDDNGKTPIHIIIQTNKVDDEGYPQQQQQKSSQKLLPLQVYNLERLNLFLELVQRAKHKRGLQLQDRKGNTPLHAYVMELVAGRAIVLPRNIHPCAMGIILIEAYPEAIGIKNDEGFNPLHIIATKVLCKLPQSEDPPSGDKTHLILLWDFFCTLVQTYPQALSKRDYTRGFTPLHYICEKDICPHLVERVLVAERDGYRHQNNEDESDEDDVVWCSPAACIQDRKGLTPLHLACLGRADDRAFRCLVEYGPKAVNIRDYDEYTPLYRAWYTRMDWFRIVHASLQGVDHRPLSPSVKTMVDEYFGTLELLIKTSYVKYSDVSERYDESKIIHACAGIDCPTPIFLIALMLNPDEAMKCDEQGHLPLHVACKSQAAPCIPTPLLPTVQQEHIEDDYDITEQNPSFNWSIIRVLLQIDPLAVLVRDRTGRLPLHLAINSRKLWNNGISDILCEAPHMISIRDPVTGLFPFMLSASVASDKSYDEALKESNDASLALAAAEKKVNDAEDAAKQAEELADLTWKDADKHVDVKNATERKTIEAWSMASMAFDNFYQLQEIAKEKELRAKHMLLFFETTYNLLMVSPSLITCNFPTTNNEFSQNHNFV